jgi:6-phosphogluconolactonase
VEESGQLMFSRDIKVVKNADALSSLAANLFVDLARESIAIRGSFTVALAGGSTPRKLYSLLASQRYRNEFDWKRVSFFFGDERHVPPDSDESNYRMANETLLAPLNIIPENVHRWHAEFPDSSLAAEQYQDELKALLNSHRGSIDLVLLGLGDDAHTASLFPNTAALGESERLAVANWVEKLDAYRLTMTPLTINGARNIIFLVSGQEKAKAVAQVLEGEFRPEDYPAQLVIPQDGVVYWLLDEAAASQLKLRNS